MKRTTLITSIVIIGTIVIILLGFNLTRTEIGSMLEKDDITKISVFYQPDFSTFDITDETEIESFLNIVLNCEIQKQEEGKESTGYIYLMTLYNGDIEYGRISLGNSISIYPNDYIFIEGDVDSETLINYLDKTYDVNMENRME